MKYLEKSFSVAVGSFSSDQCQKCGSENTGYKINGKRLCKECFSITETSIHPLNIDGDTDFIEFNIVDVHSTGKPLHFTSRKKWKEHLKSKGLTDDLTPKELLNFKSKKEKIKWGDTVIKALKEDGAKYAADVKYGRISNPLKKGR